MDDKQIEFRTKCAAAVKGLKKALNARNLRYETWVERYSETPRIGLRGAIRVDVDFVKERQYGYRTTGKLRIVVGAGYPARKKQFPERKAGFDYEAIAAEILTQYNAERQRQLAYVKETKTLKSWEAAARRVQKSLPRPWPWTGVSLDVNTRGLTVEVRDLNEEEALLLLVEVGHLIERRKHKVEDAG